MKGIILAGGSGTRLYPLTRGVSKQLLPVYDKPMIHYPLSVLLLTGLREILIITTPQHQRAFKDCLGDGSQWGVRLEYVVQPSPEGLAQAFLLGEEFLSGDSASLILGDNLFFGHGLQEHAVRAARIEEGAVIFATQVDDPERYGVATFAADGRVLSLDEKPKKAKSRWAVTGLYFYDRQVVEYARTLKPSARGELEITDLNRIYLELGKLQLIQLGRDFVWLDAGTVDSLHDAGGFVRTVQARRGLRIACLEEIAIRKGFVSPAHGRSLANECRSQEHRQHLLDVCAEVEARSVITQDSASTLLEGAEMPCCAVDVASNPLELFIPGNS